MNDGLGAGPLLKSWRIRYLGEVFVTAFSWAHAAVGDILKARSAERERTPAIDRMLMSSSFRRNKTDCLFCYSPVTTPIPGPGSTECPGSPRRPTRLRPPRAERSCGPEAGPAGR